MNIADKFVVDGKPWIIFSDFDGTITKIDTLKFLLDNFGASNWMEIEYKVKDGSMSEREALQAEFSTLNVSWIEAIESILESIDIDSGFAEFIEWIERIEMKFVILSGGVHEIIEPILKREGLKNIEVRANNVQITGKKWRLIPSDKPKIKNNCNHCKTCSIVEMKDSGWRTIFIGDGLTDRCPAESADLVFAKDELAEFCLEQKLDFIPYKDFSDIKNTLEKYLAAVLEKNCE